MKSERGQSTVELALTLTVLMLIVFAIVDFGRVFHAYLTIEHAGREAARAASVGGSDTRIRDAAFGAATGLDQTKVGMTIYPSQSERKRGTYTKITLEYEIDISTPLMAQIIPNPLTIDNQTVMRVE